MSTRTEVSELARTPLSLVGIGELIALAIGKREQVRVEGQSMVPTVLPGDLVLVDPAAYRRKQPSVGDIVLCRHPFRSDVKLIKRVAGLNPDGAMDLRGDNPKQSTDSSTLGAVPFDHLLGRVTSRR